MRPSQVLVVDDFEPFRERISSLLRESGDFEVIGQVSDGQEAVQKAEALKPDLILLDIGLPTLSGIEAARQISALSPKSKIVFVSSITDPSVVETALSNGAVGYILKSDAIRLPDALAAVLRGEKFVSPGLGKKHSAD